MNKKTIKDINITGKRILLRTDYNVSLRGAKIADDTRIRQTFQTLNFLLAKKCTIIIISHLDDPGGKYNEKLSLRLVARDLEKILGKKVYFETDYLSQKGQEKIDRFGPKKIILLENLRFNPQEEANDSEFAQKLAQLGEIFVNDGFGVSHRQHASVVGIAKFLPAVAGLLLEKEVNIISQTLAHSAHPFVAIVGGAKTETKINLLGKLMEKADTILLGGCLANTFLLAKGFSLGKSVVDRDAVGRAKRLLAQAKAKKVEFVLPVDVVLGKPDTNFIDPSVPVDKIAPQLQAFDIGPQTEALFGRVIDEAKTIIWSGPMGMIENNEYARGTDFIFYAISQNRQARSIVGGGDTIAAIGKKEYLEGITHISTGGGAMLEFIEKGTLPGIEVLEDK